MNGVKLQLLLCAFMTCTGTTLPLSITVSYSVDSVEITHISTMCTDARLANGGSNCSSLCTSCIVTDFLK
jgi:hypothetical protein